MLGKGKNVKRYLKGVMALNVAAIVRGIRFGLAEFRIACNRGFYAVDPLENGKLHAIRKQLNSIPEIHLGKIIRDQKLTIRLTVTEYEDGMLPVKEAMALLAIVVTEQPKEILEIGTYMGHTTKLMAENLKNSTIHTIDLPEDYNTDIDPIEIPKDDFHLIRRRMVGREFKGHSCEKTIKQYFADTAEWDFREAGKPELFFIDGSHTYEYCKSDSEKCFELAGGKGVFLWHDCDVNHPGVVKLISEWRALGRNVVRIQDTSLAYWKNT